LVEIMIVIVIIGLLAGVITVNVRSYMLRARQETARSEIARIQDALDTYYTAYSRYPANDKGLSALTEPSEKFPEPILTSADLTDPWDQPYIYLNPGRTAPVEVISYGADGQPGGEGADADLTSANLKE
jgi:general secretion pathway protein G